MMGLKLINLFHKETGTLSENLVHGYLKPPPLGWSCMGKGRINGDYYKKQYFVRNYIFRFGHYRPYNIFPRPRGVKGNFSFENEEETVGGEISPNTENRGGVVPLKAEGGEKGSYRKWYRGRRGEFGENERRWSP